MRWHTMDRWPGRADRPPTGKAAGSGGFAMLLVIVSVALAVLLALTLFTAKATSAGIARNIESHGQARLIAESGLEVGIALVHRSAGTWREDYGEGVWVADHPYADGSFTLIATEAEDDDEGLFEGDEEMDTELVVLESIGEYRGVTHTVHARLRGTADPLPPGHVKQGRRSEMEYAARWVERP